MYHSRSTLRRASLAAATVAAVTAGLITAGPAAFADPPSSPSAADPGGPAPEYEKPTVVYDDLTLPDGRTAQVYSDGHAVIMDLTAGTREIRLLPAYDIMRQPSGTTKLVVDRSQVLADLIDGARTPYHEGRVRVVLADGVRASEPVTTVPAGTVDRLAGLSGSALAAAAPDYTSSPALNQKLADLGTARMAPIVDDLPASATPAAGGLNLANAFVLDVADSQTATAVEELLASPDVAYASPDWTVSPLKTQSFPVSQADLDRALAASQNPAPAATPEDSTGEGASLPTNYALSASMQSLLNRPGINWTEAYQILQERYHQLPGEGQIITNVSVGYLTDADTPSDDRCAFGLAVGPTTVVADGQRYLDLPSLPLIPAYTVETDGTLNPTGTSCGADPLDGEIDLDFAVMAGLPHDQQREGAIGEGYTDLLGVAPGADYRLVVPGGRSTDVSDIDAALLAAAQQNPRPDVITASLGFGFDTLGFPSRYLEEDPITQAVVSTLTHDFDITVTIASGDGLRQFTRTAWGPTGGSAALDVVGDGETPTDLADLQMSTAPSRVADSGAIAVGGTTLDDVFSAPPQDPANAELAAQHAFPITRFNGMRIFSSGFGSRVNVSAPGDNILAFQHVAGGQANQVEPIITGGTSASAPIVAATAAVVKQTAELVGDSELAADPLRLRSWLERTGTPVPNAPQADQRLHVGPQVDLGAAVSQLVSGRARNVPAGVARVAVEQRRPVDARGGIFLGDTDAANISLANNGQVSWITIAPDWTGGVASGWTRYALRVGDTTLARTSYARLSPERIFTAAGKTFPPTERTSITLTYTARHWGTRVSTEVPLTFTPASGGFAPLAPLVPAVVTGDTIPVTYDVSMFTNIDQPALVVTGPGRISPWDTGWHIMYQKVLDDFAGTVEVPVSALQGGGIYGVAIEAGLTGPSAVQFSRFAATRIPGARSDTRPPAPTVSQAGEESGQHILSVGYTDSVTVRWDVRDVRHSTGARLEVSPPGPTWDVGRSYNTVNNANGTVRDDNKLDTGSVVDLALPGTHGQITLTGDELGLVPGGYQQVRVRPTGRRGHAVGEASDVSTIHRLGITGPDGEALWGFGVDQHGDTGVMVTSTGIFGSGHATVSTFDQATGEPTGVLWESSTQRLSTVGTSGAAMFAGHTALIEALDNETRQVSFTAINVNTGERHAWEPPDGYLPLDTDNNSGWFLRAADEQDSPNAAFAAIRFGSGWRVFSSNVAEGTFGPVVDLSPSLSTLSLPLFLGIAQDPTTDTAYLSVADLGDGNHSYVIAVNLVDGSQRLIDLGLTNFFVGDGIAVNPASHTAMVAGSDTVRVVDLDTGEFHETVVLGGTGRNQWITADRTRGLYLDYVEIGIGTLQPNRYAMGWVVSDANRTANVAVLDTEGHVITILPSFILASPVRLGGASMQVDPSTGTGYVLGGDRISLAPFHYAD